MSGATERRAVLFVESNTSGTGRLFVRQARALGFRPVLVTAKPEKYAWLAEDDAPAVIVLPAIEDEALYALAADRLGGSAGIAGVTSSSEYFVATAAALAARLGLPGPDASAVRAARDKSWQRRALAAGGVAVPAFRAVESAAEAVRAADGIGYPVVLKPVAGSGSVGVRACADADEVEAHACALFADDPAQRVLVEELVEGPEFSVEMFGGRVIGITRKHLGAPPAFVEAGHDYPAVVSADVAAALAKAAVRGTEVLGLGWGPLHWELRVDARGRAVPMEVNPRLAGGFIPELVRHAQGIDLIRETLRLVVGERPRVSAEYHGFSSIRFVFAPGDGRLAAAEGVAEARGIPGVVEVALYRGPGDELRVHGDFRDRIGHAMARAADAEAAAAAAVAARDAVRMVVEGTEDAETLALAGAAGGRG